MIESTIICPNCKTEIKLTESLAAPLIEATRKQYEQQLAQKDSDIAVREKAANEKEKELSEAKAKLAEAQKAQAELIRKQRELDDAKRELELTVETRVQESLTATRDQAKKEAEESMRLKVAEKEQTIASMQTQIAALKRKAELGSQQLQGEVLELGKRLTNPILQ